MSAKNHDYNSMPGNMGMKGSKPAEKQRVLMKADQGSVTKPMTGKLTPGHTMMRPYGHKGGSSRGKS